MLLVCNYAMTFRCRQILDTYTQYTTLHAKVTLCTGI